MATNETIKLKVSSNQKSVPLDVDSGSPYYVGARAYVTQNDDGATITVTDKEGTTTATVYNGQDGEAGETGADGFSPIATVSKADNVTTITITDVNGTTTADVYDGVGAITDVTVDGTSIVDSDGIAVLETATQLRNGLMTSFDKQKLDGVESGAEVNLVDDVQVDGVSVVSGGVAEIDLTGKADVSDIPTNVSDLTNDAGYISSYTETDPVFLASAAHGITSSDISAWNGKSTVSVNKKTSTGVNIADITINGTTTQLYAPQGGGGTITDVTVDGTSVVSGGVAEIDLTGKSDIGHTHTTSAITDFPTIPSKTSDLTNDSGFITGYTETDPVFSASAAAGITSSDISSWNGKSTFSGNYNDLTNKPTIPTKVSDLSNDSGFLTTAVTSFNGNTGAVTYTAPVTSVNGNTGAVTISVPTITDTYSGTSSNGMSGKAVKSAIDALDGTVSGSAGAGKTLTAFSQTDGKVSATFGNISITKSQVSDFPTIPSTAADVGAVPTTRTVNGHALSSNVTVTKSDVGLGNVVNGANMEITSYVDMYDADDQLMGRVYAFEGTIGNNNFNDEFVNAVWVQNYAAYCDDYFVAKSQKGASNGVCPLNASGKIDVSYLPVYNGGVI